MDSTTKIIELASQNNGIVTAAMISSAGISRGSLKYLADTGRLDQVSRGVYTLPEVWEDEFVSIQERYKRGVFALDTALFLHDLTDRTPHKFHMAFPYGYNTSRNVISLPRTALTEEQGIFFIYLQLDEEDYKKQEVTIGADNGKSVQILTGVKAGDRVVTEGAYQVRLASASNAIPAHSHEH